MKGVKLRYISKASMAALLAIALLPALGACQGATEAADGVEVLEIAFSPGGVNSFYDDDGELTGFEVELLREVDERLEQYEFNLQQIEYKSFFPSLETGKVDLVCANLRRNAERESYLHTYRGYNTWWNVFVVLEDDDSINGIEDLDNKKVGTSQGTLSATYMENYIAETGRPIELVYSSDWTSDLIAGKVDTFIGPDYSVPLYNEQYADEGIAFKIVGDPVGSNEGVETDKNVYWFLASGREDARDAISDAVYEIRQDGTLTKLFTEFYGYDRTDTIDIAEEEKYMRSIGKL